MYNNIQADLKHFSVDFYRLPYLKKMHKYFRIIPPGMGVAVGVIAVFIQGIFEADTFIAALYLQKCMKGSYGTLVHAVS